MLLYLSTTAHGYDKHFHFTCRHQLQGVVQYCRARMLPMQLQNRLLQYFEFQHQKMLDSDGSRILRLLPESLRVKVASQNAN